MAASHLIELRDVVKTFGRRLALRNVNVRVTDGEFVVILGPSGCGKTTLLRIIAGLEQPTSGAVSGQLENVGMVFQSLALFPHMSVRDNVGFGPSMRGKRRKDVDAIVQRVLSLVHLEDLAQQNVQTLSGGQQQRVAIARALANAPAMLLMDEPLKSLDRHLQEELQRELAALHRETRGTFILVTHDQAEAFRLATRIVIMNRGQVVQDGDPTTVYDQPADAFVARFSGWKNVLPLRRHVSGEIPSRALAAIADAGVPPTRADQYLCFRPEHVTLRSAPSDDSVAGVVRSVWKQVPLWECQIQVGAVSILAACSAAVAGTLAEGQPVYVRLDEARIVPAPVGDEFDAG